MTTLEQLQNNWPILGGFVAGILAWGRTTNSVSSLNEKHNKIDERVSKIEGHIVSIKESAAAVAASAEGTQRAVELLLKRELGA